MTESLEDFQKRGHWVALESNQHRHAATCHKGIRGSYACRECYPRAFWNNPTSVLKIENVAGHNVPLARKSFTTKDPRQARNLLYGYNDYQALVIELHRPSDNPDPALHEDPLTPDHYVDFIPPDNEHPGSNAYVAAFNVWLSASLGCNINVEYLGTCSQAKAASFYVVCVPAIFSFLLS